MLHWKQANIPPEDIPLQVIPVALTPQSSIMNLGFCT